VEDVRVQNRAAFELYSLANGNKEEEKEEKEDEESNVDLLRKIEEDSEPANDNYQMYDDVIQEASHESSSHGRISESVQVNPKSKVSGYSNILMKQFSQGTMQVS